MIKFPPNGTSAKMTFGLKPTRVKTIRGRLGDGAKEQTFVIGFNEIIAGWKDNRIEAVFKAGSDTYVHSIALEFHYKSPQSSSETEVWTESYSDDFNTRHRSSIPGILTRKAHRRGSWALWISEGSGADGVLFKQPPPAEYPLSFDCRPGKHRITITWELRRRVKEGELVPLPDVGIARGKRDDVVFSWHREWFAQSSRTPSPDRRVGFLAGEEISGPRDLREVLAEIRGARLPVEWYAAGPQYASATGDWLKPGEAYKDRMGSISRAIGEQGIIPGLRFAPFLVSRKSAIGENNKDWLVKTAKGTPVMVAGYGPDRDQSCILDVTNPEVVKHLSRTFSVMRDQWGFRAYVLERLADLTVPGIRHDPTVGPGKLVSTSSELIRHIVGPKVLLVAENSPLLADIGTWDAKTVAPSIGHFSKTPSKRRQQEALSVATAQLHRAPWNGKAWINASGPLPLAFFDVDAKQSIETATRAAAVSCGMVTLSGDPRNLTEESRENIMEFLAMFTDCRRGRLTVVPEIGGGRISPLIARNDRGWIGLFNMSGRKRGVRLDRDRLRSTLGVVAPLSAGDGVVFNSPEIHVSLPPRGHRLFKG